MADRVCAGARSICVCDRLDSSFLRQAALVVESVDPQDAWGRGVAAVGFGAWRWFR